MGTGTTPYTALQQNGSTLNIGGGSGADGTFTAIGLAASATVTGSLTATTSLISPALTSTAGLSITSGGANAITVDTGGSSTITLAGTNATSVLIGSASTSNATQHLLQLNSFTTYADTATCSTSTDQGALYYNTTTNAIRGCINGNWEDMVSTSGMGILLFGVVPDSGAAPGDLQALSSSNVSGPCKVSWASATSVTVQACTIYTGGRKITQTQVTITLPAMATSTFTHLCYYSGGAAAGPLTNSTAWFTTSSTTETANLPTFSASNPVACIATIKNSTSTANTIGQVYDTRVFNNSQKQFAYTAAAVAPGWLTIALTTNTTEVTTTTTAATKGLAGVVVAGNSSAWSSGGPNAIIATGGPVEVEATAGATTAYNYIETTTTAGYATTVTTASSTLSLPNLYLGLALTSFGSCATPSATTCQGSLFTQILWMD